MEQFYGDEVDDNVSEERISLAGSVEPLAIIPSAGGVATEDDGLDFFDNDLTD